MVRHLLVVLTVSCLVWFSAGCGGDEEVPGEEGLQVEETADVVPAGSATVEGVVRFEGMPPERQRINQARECEELHEEPVLTDNVVVNDDGTLRHVFVYVREGLEGQSFPTPQEPVVLDQENCMYEPHVFGIQTGQTLRILNSDPLQHNIHALPEENRPFNYSTPMEGMEREATFRTPEVMVRIKCDVHPWMLAWAGVVAHPYFDTTGDEGAFSLENLPAGQYTIEAWHEEYGTQTQTVTVGEDETATVDFTFRPQPAS